MLLRWHFYAGVLVGPFLLVAALSGALYAATPQLEQVVYRDELRVDPSPTQLPLGQQVEAAFAVHDAEDLVAVRPAPTPSDTTRVMFAVGDLAESETRAVFVDPGTGEVRGELTVYGTSGVLPLRTWVSQLHRHLHLGEPGRLYSELAASWLWVLALSGLVLWTARARRRARARRLLLPDLSASGRRRTRSFHGAVGAWTSLGLLALSATGLTWSTYAGAGVSDLRSALGWSTPAVSTALPGSEGTSEPAGEHADHGGLAGHEGHGADVHPAALASDYERALAVARDGGIDAGKVEVEPPAGEGAAWTVTEIDRGFPTDVDAASVDPASGTVVDRVDFADHPLMAKLARWGVDLHMGSWGLLNQLVLLALALGLACTIVWGYRMWWQRRPDLSRRGGVGRPYPRGALRSAPPWAVALVGLAALAVGWALPLLGVSLLAFLAVDVLLGLRARLRRRTPAGA
ncbi:PepSY domain-containing protein [Vallicoccus soli]|uniref:PepSY domain-containing protein n=1 Tax=Vallicoccus soli TaxID=2339232 RepID=A0A3A3Z209_9ACTN|nr:PepSY domain-containing protein [Vallicoccus soli]